MVSDRTPRRGPPANVAMADHQAGTEEVSSSNICRSLGSASQFASSDQMRFATLQSTKMSPGLRLLSVEWAHPIVWPSPCA
ncbi:hypothetical protein PVAP13_7NG012489 [Panicum virgatum]|uniref:Uncharacterized protein n=1 Tax=Panicum virgatum TaxID=38727 RepID=A0A8T0PRP1_PANVG|nr:hypothetical protein PVAP13_7NG012489 [Panicum virgatum]